MSDQTSSNPSSSKAQSAIQSLSSIISSIPPSLSSSPNPAFSLLHDPGVASQISSLLRRPNSGVGDDPLCRWLYDTFQSSDDDLRLVVLRFLPTLAGVYLSRVALRKPLAGFEAVLLALYAHETAARDGQPVTVTVPELSNPSIYHDTTALTSTSTSATTPIAAATITDPCIAVVSPSLEPHGTVRSTRRARIVGVALELYYSKIAQMPVGSKVEFCESCHAWAGQDGEMYKEDDVGEEEASGGGEKREGRIGLPWELLQPVLRILGHCLLGGEGGGELWGPARKACRGMHVRAVHDVNARAILATQSLLRLGKMAAMDARDDWDTSEIPKTNAMLYPSDTHTVS